MGGPRVADVVEGGGAVVVEGTLEVSLRPVREVVPTPVQEVWRKCGGSEHHHVYTTTQHYM